MQYAGCTTVSNASGSLPRRDRKDSRELKLTGVSVAGIFNAKTQRRKDAI
jgi:hypothetical protein